MHRKLDSGMIKVLEQYRDELVRNCTKCGGTGFKAGGKLCICSKRYELYVELAYAGIPEEYWKYHLSSFPGDPAVIETIRDYKRNLAEFFDNGIGLCFQGGLGVGKTSLGIDILKNAARKGYSVCYKSMSQVIQEVLGVRGSKGDTSITEAIWKAEMMVDFLFIDEGRSYICDRKDWKIALLDEQFKRRIERKKVTLLATTLPIGKGNGISFKDYYGGSIYSYLRGALHIVHIEGEDLRKDVAKKQFDKITRKGKK